MSKNVYAIVQARVSSTRLPGKVLKKLAGKEMLWHVVERLKKCKRLDGVIVAASTSKADDKIEELASENKWDFFRGSEEDVLSRYLGAAKKFNAGTIVRVTSDCPLISPELVDKCIELHFNSGADFSNVNRVEKTLPRGQEIEAFSLKALEKAAKNSSTKAEKEHVTLYFYHSKPDEFKIATYRAEGKIARPELRLVVDTKEDFEAMEKIYSALYSKGDIIPLEKGIEFLDSHPEIRALNAETQQKFVEGKQY